MNQSELLKEIYEAHYKNIQMGYEYVEKLSEVNMTWIGIILGLLTASVLGFSIYASERNNNRFDKIESKLDSLVKKTSDSN